ncbi:Complex I intermediate-associated protein 30 [Hirsutella minnesotensis 3608]|nr:Complex I intermediate-associated protein 30 [Hirsutella minnesotensis 3608]
MKATQSLLARGFLGRSIDELRRRSAIAWNLEAVKGPSGPRELYNFASQDSVLDCVLMSDRLIGGSSQSNLDFVPSESTAPSGDSQPSPSPYARFHGQISTSLPADRPNIERSGYAGFRTPEQRTTVFGKSLWDIDPYTYLAMRIKSDGRAYFINLQTVTVEPTDLHQHRLFAKRPGHWETVMVKWNDFVRTNHGFVVEPQTELMRQKVRTVGIGLTDRVEGPFELCIERIWATNQLTEDATVVKSDNSQLRNRRGETIQW